MTNPNPKVSGQRLKVVRSGRTILDVESIAVRPSEILAIIGPNGAGKSTLLRVLALLMQPDRGEVRIGNTLVDHHNEAALRRRLACIFQSPLLLDRTVFANVELGLRLRGVPKRERRETAHRWLETVGLAHLAHQDAKTVSGGEGQRVNIARALALAPEVFFMDEPFDGLDTPTRHALIDQIGPLVRDGAGAGCLVTHDRRVAMTLGDRVAVMLDGGLRQIGSPADVFAKPVDLDVARFVGIENILRGRADAGAIHIDGAVALCSSSHVRGEAVMCLRAEELYFGKVPGMDGGWNVLNGTVTKLVRRGDGFGVDVDVGCTLTGRLTRARQALLELAPGKSVPVCIRPDAIHLIENSTTSPV